LIVGRLQAKCDSERVVASGLTLTGPRLPRPKQRVGLGALQVEERIGAGELG
jgi:hypothetical protein